MKLQSITDHPIRTGTVILQFDHNFTLMMEKQELLLLRDVLSQAYPKEKEASLIFPKPTVIDDPSGKLVENPWKGLAVEMAEILKFQTPNANCSCHLSPPCNDCVEFAHTRELIVAFDKLNEAPP